MADQTLTEVPDDLREAIRIALASEDNVKSAADRAAEAAWKWILAMPQDEVG